MLWHSGPSLQAHRRGKGEAVTDFIFVGSKIPVDGDCHEIKRLLQRKDMTNLDSILKSRDTICWQHSQSYGFSSSYVWMWELDHKEGWCFWIVLEKTLESPVDSKDIKPVNPKGNQLWIFIRRTDAKAPILWPPDSKKWLIGKDPTVGKDWRQEEKGTTEDKMIGWHHQLNRHEFGQALGVGNGQGSLVCCSPWGHKKSDTTEWLKWTEMNSCIAGRFFTVGDSRKAQK